SLLPGMGWPTTAAPGAAAALLPDVPLLAAVAAPSPPSLPRPLLGAPPGDELLTAAVVLQGQGEQATLETRQPDVQWSPSGAARWQSIADRQAVNAGDRVRTGPGAAGRLVYFEG